MTTAATARPAVPQVRFGEQLADFCHAERGVAGAYEDNQT
jgi:hypothetical protein